LFHQPFHVVGIAEQVVGSARRYVIGGSTPTGAFAALGVQENGRPDPTFGVAGRATNESTTDLDPDIAIARGFAIEPGNGRIVVAGQVGQSGGDIGGNPLVARFTPNGVPDVRFGLAGVTGATINYGEEAPGVGVTVAPGGAIYVTGSFEYYKTGTDEDFVLWRFQPDGSVDRSFGGYGYLLLDNGGTSPDPALPANRQWVIGDFAQTVVVQPDGKPIVSGARFVVGCSTGCPHTFFYRAEAVRLLHNGKPDPSFGTNGWVTGPAGDGRALALQGNRVLIGGDLSDQPPLGTHYVSQPPPPGMRLGLRVTQFAR
jgi:uncharacterized delta-60 repeat protein